MKAHIILFTCLVIGAILFSGLIGFLIGNVFWELEHRDYECIVFGTEETSKVALCGENLYWTEHLN